MNVLRYTRRREVFSLDEVKTFLNECVNACYALTLPADHVMGVGRIGVVFTCTGYESEDDSSSRTAVTKYTQYSYGKDNSMDIVNDIADNLWQIVEHFPFLHARVLNIYAGFQIEATKIPEEE